MAQPPLTFAVPEMRSEAVGSDAVGCDAVTGAPSPSADGETIPSPLVADLMDGEHLIIWMFRRLVVTRVWCPVIDYELGRLMRRHEADIREALQRFLAYLAHYGQRKLRIGMPGFPVITMDEQMLIAVMAAAQAQDVGRLQALMPWLLGRSECRGLLPLLTIIGAGFALNGLTIRRPPVPKR